MVSSRNGDVTSALKQIASDASKTSIDESYNDPGSAVKEFGGGTSNNMLLRAIHAEMKRNTDETLKLRSTLSTMADSIVTMVSKMQDLCDSIEEQTTIISSQHNRMGDGTTNSSDKQPNSRKQASQQGTKWYYRGIDLTPRPRQIACLISQFIDIVKTKLEHRDIYYPDSVDCDFTVLEYCVTGVSKVRCTIPSVIFKNTIELPPTSSPVYSRILPLIASTDQSEPILLSESRLDEVYAPQMRDLTTPLERIVERLCRLDHILSPQQIDILKSLHTPIAKDGELNFNITSIQPRSSHAILSSEIGQCSITEKKTYIEQIMKNQPPMQAYKTAKDKLKK